MKRGLLLIALALLSLGASRCRQLTPTDPTPPGPKEPPITIPTSPPATPNPGPSIPPRDPPGEPDEEPAPPAFGSCPCAWKFGLTKDATWVDGAGKIVEGPVAGGWGSADTTEKFTPKDVACDPGHPNCGGLECNDPRGPLFRIQGPTGFDCDDSGGPPCPRADPWSVKVGGPSKRLVPGTYTITASLRPDLEDGYGKPLAVCQGGPVSTTRSWGAK